MSFSFGFVEFEIFEPYKRKMSRGRWMYVWHVADLELKEEI